MLEKLTQPGRGVSGVGVGKVLKFQKYLSPPTPTLALAILDLAMNPPNARMN